MHRDCLYEAAIVEETKLKVEKPGCRSDTCAARDLRTRKGGRAQ